MEILETKNGSSWLIKDIKSALDVQLTRVTFRAGVLYEFHQEKTDSTITLSEEQLKQIFFIISSREYWNEVN